MGVPFYKTFMKVTVPMCLPAILEVAMYYFVNAMVTVSAVIFLYTADFKLAAVSIVNMDDAGNLASAAAMSILIVVTNILVRVCYELMVKWMKNRKALKEER
jgi:iron(III) transport system permease protein